MRKSTRLVALAPHALGLGLAVALLWGGSRAVEYSAEDSEPFSVWVQEPAPVYVLSSAAPSGGGQAGDRNRSQEDRALGPLTWRAEAGPPRDLERVTASVDGQSAEVERDLSRGSLSVSLPGLEDAPGWHFVEVVVERRGGRRERSVDPILVGHFGRSRAPGETGGAGGGAGGAGSRPACGVAMSVSPALIQRLLRPMLEAELMPELRKVEQLGPDTQLREAKLELRDDALRFELEVAGVNSLALSGVVGVWISETGTLEVKLVTLGKIEFHGRIRNRARGIGVGGGALLGGLISGPLAPVGAAVGWWLADELVTDQAQKIVREQAEEGLAAFSGLDLLPERVALVPGRPESTVELGFCALTRVRKTGVRAGLWVRPVRGTGDAANPEFDLGVPGPLVTGVEIPDQPLDVNAGEDLRLELSIDLVNALVLRATETGLLSELAGEQEALVEANRELAAWTPLRLSGLEPTRPIVLTPVGGPEAGWAFGFGGLEVGLTHIDGPAASTEVDARWGRLALAGAGTVALAWDPEAGTLGLSGTLDRLELGCLRSSPERPGWTHVDGCFSEVLEAADLRGRIDAQLRPGPGASSLPSLALGSLLGEALGLHIESLELSRPGPSRLRLSAQLSSRSGGRLD